MQTDPGQAELDARVAAASVEERVKWTADKRLQGLRTVWQQADAAGIDNPVEQAEFILRRLYPEMPESWFADVVAKLAAKHVAGEWHGFQRPMGLGALG